MCMCRAMFRWTSRISSCSAERSATNPRRVLHQGRDFAAPATLMQISTAGPEQSEELSAQLRVPVDVLVEQVPEPARATGVAGLRAEGAQPHEVALLHLHPV